ncbi:MAG: hypothetical protein A2674_02725, partial [Candidatus Wildermuthbacteria bacterium RIFCSPHIGHO2_01_FULL_50_47]
MFTPNHWYAKDVFEVLGELRGTEQGLSEQEAKKRLESEGQNILPEPKTDSVLIIFLRQFKSPLIYILLGAAVLVFAMGDYVDALIIATVLALNATIGTYQEGRAQNTLLALKKFAETKSTVVRGGKEYIVRDRELVPGDVIILQEGEKVPADGRVFVSNNLRADESGFTGESTPVHKMVEMPSEVLELGEGIPVSEQRTMVFKGTMIVAGNGKAIVTATGVRTIIGKISQEIGAISTDVPLKANIQLLSRFIVGATFSISAFLFLTGVFVFGKDLLEMFKLIVALAVSFIPEGLPVALTLVLVAGVWRMAKRNALVKRLQAVEALGQAQVIAVDKTGTVTTNELVTRKAYIAGRVFHATGDGYNPEGNFFLYEELVHPQDFPELQFAGKAAAFSASANVSFDEKAKRWNVTGDPTEAAILVFGQKLGYQGEKWEEQFPLVYELPFDFTHKVRLVVREDGNEYRVFVTGAPEHVMALCGMIWMPSGRQSRMTEKERTQLEAVFHGMTREGLRVVAFATAVVKPRRRTEAANPFDWIQLNSMPKLAFCGFWGMQDTVRPEARAALTRAREAGMRVVMVTGDHKLTAQAIAREVGIWQEGDDVLTGYDIGTLSDEELDARLGKVSVFARVAPEHKLRIIQGFRRRGEIIAMTGDGVNDAPSLVAADLGVSMGRVGTEVAKEASDIVLLDDDFGSIVSAAEEGRSIYRTIRKILQYVLSTNTGEVLTIAAVLFLFPEHPLPLIAVQILWMNFVTDGFLMTALAMEPKEKNLLNGFQKKPGKYLVDAPLLGVSLFIGLTIAVGSVLVFSHYLQEGVVVMQTMVLTTMACYQWFRAWSARAGDSSLFRISPF